MPTGGGDQLVVHLGTDAAVLYMTGAHGPHSAGTYGGAAGRENVV